MSNKPLISELNPEQALAQALQASRRLLEKLGEFTSYEEEQIEATNKLLAVREQLVRQVFAHPWPPEAVAAHQTSFNQLEDLNQQLEELAHSTRQTLHQQRVDNQQGRKAVSAYGKAKGQFSR